MNVKASHLTHSQQVSTSTKSESADVEIRNPSVSELQGQEENLPKQVETLARPERELEEEEEEEVEEDVKLLGEKSQSFPEPLLSFLPKETYEESENALGSGHGTDTMHPLTKPNYPSGFIDKIQYTLSDTLQNIDPVPVVGVSGEEEDTDIEFLLDSMEYIQDL
ncbi:hypothetical protein PVNG_06194 [Plasmodium vivax North Korean]|uniref:Uncharacterized protein n=1 Tax=Plasmodium vivax North Korean TaxID=1035514 RepID=A0A0J9TM86_PLAVI|nr:hypothetical protein PVNG_06194 [Plasmodium vivax North Korean]